MKQQTVLITGVTRGLGLALAKRFLEKGSRVIGVSLTRKHWSRALAALGETKSLILLQVDLRSEKEVQKLFSQIEGRAIDVLINNAGWAEGELTRVGELSLEVLEKHLSANLYTAFLMSRQILPLFQKQKHGLIVNIASMAGKRSVPRLFAYSASKFGVLALSQCIAKEYAEEGIQCFTVCPGGMNTQMREDLFGQEDARRQQSPDFVADVIVKAIDGEIPVDSGGDIVIRHGALTAINPAPVE